MTASASAIWIERLDMSDSLLVSTELANVGTPQHSNGSYETAHGKSEKILGSKPREIPCGLRGSRPPTGHSDDPYPPKTLLNRSDWRSPPGSSSALWRRKSSTSPGEK